MEILVYGFVLFVYFIPTIAGYPKKNAGAIFLLNLFLGWTVIGWVVALIWAVTKDDEPKVVPNTKAPADQIRDLHKLMTDGVISEEEYNKTKKKILGD